MKEKSTDEPVIPPDPEQMNNQRAEWAEAALDAFATATRQSMETELPDIVTDLLADIHHFCDRSGINFEERLQSAKMHYEAETARDTESEVQS